MRKGTSRLNLSVNLQSLIEELYELGDSDDVTVAGYIDEVEVKLREGLNMINEYKFGDRSPDDRTRHD
jgi:hypothetical protein